MSRDPVEGDSDPPSTQGVEGALDSTGFDPVYVSAGGVGGARVNGILTVREDGVAGWGGFLAWREGIPLMRSANHWARALGVL